MDVVANLVAEIRGEPSVTSLEDWARDYRMLMAAGADPMNAALCGGARTDRLAYAFASGYSAAVHALVPAIGARIACLCATEGTGAHPRSIETALEATNSGYVLRGRKCWGTLAPVADVLVVLARAGVDPTGRPKLCAVLVERGAPGLTLTEVPRVHFVPEIPHADVQLDEVAVAEDQVLPGDGYERYLKPFRTVEDIHVMSAAIAHVLCLAFHASEKELFEDLLASVLTLASLAQRDPTLATTHIALAGELRAVRQRFADATRVIAGLSPEVSARWERDRALFTVAESVRQKRRTSAWQRFIDAAL